MTTVRCVRRMACIIPLLAAMLTGSIALAQAPGYLVTSFETEADLFTPMDPSIEGTAAVALSYSEGVTQGFASMETVPTGFAWSWLQKNFDAATYQQWYAHNKLSIDFTRVTTAAGNFELVAAMNGPQGWNQQQILDWTAGWQGPGTTTTRTLVWDYSAIRAAAPAPGSGAEADYWQLNFLPRTNPDYAPQFGYIDNIRFIDPLVPPEPSELLWAANSVSPGGSGTWNTDAFTWLDGPTATTWNQYGRAVFGGTGGPVAVAGTVPVQAGMRFETNGYTLSGGAIELAANAAQYNSINVGPGASAAIDAALTGSTGFTKTGTGTLTLGGVNTVSGTATVAAGTLVAANSMALSAASVVVPTGGRLEVPAGVALNAAEVRLTGGSLAAPALVISQATAPQPIVLNSFETVEQLYPATTNLTNVQLVTGEAGVTTGITEGTGAQQGQLFGTAWEWSFKKDYGSFYADWKDHKKLAIDVTRVTPAEGGANLEMVLSFNGGMGWNQRQVVNWVWQGGDQTSVTTAVWDYSAIAAAAPEESGWMEINIMARNGDNVQPQTVYFDNLRLIDPLVPPTQGIGSLVIESGSIVGSPDVTVANGGVLRLPTDSRFTLAATSLTVNTAVDQPAGGGLVDLGAGQISVAAGGISAADLRADIIAGRNGGAWNGTTGITSATAAGSGGTRAVGYVVNGDGSSRVSFAASGDVDLNGQVNVFDLVSINSSGKYGTGTTAVWGQGDFNYDGVTNVFDLVSVNTAGVYGQGNYFPAAVGATGGLTAVPEPSALGLVAAGLGLAALVRRSSRR